MRTFILKCAALAAIVVSLLAVAWTCPGVSTYELSSVINKMELLEGTRPPRLIFVGGSNLAALDSRRIGRETGRAVVNLSIWYGLDYRLFFEVLKGRLRPGDTIVFIPEYHVFFTDEVVYLAAESDRILCMVSPRGQAARFIGEGRPLQFARVFLDILQIKSKTFVQNVKAGKWERLGKDGLQDYEKYFDECGDFVAGYLRVRPLGGAETPFGACALERALFLNDFYPWARRNNIGVLVSFPPYPDAAYRAVKKPIDRYYRSLRASLRFPVMASPDMFVLPEEYFMDSVYHINGKGEEIRTGTIIRELKGVLRIHKK